jgi:hypothetical protein
MPHDFHDMNDLENPPAKLRVMKGRNRRMNELTTSRKLGVPGEGLPARDGSLLLKFELDMSGIFSDLCSFVWLFLGIPRER